ncbi:MAG: hypothetical protein IJA77_12375, partial [Clostridia bacterium]|nr:hypothetical protein [Clostridia bacterium]
LRVRNVFRKAKNAPPRRETRRIRIESADGNYGVTGNSALYGFGHAAFLPEKADLTEKNEMG